jgi:hypothetical protein
MKEKDILQFVIDSLPIYDELVAHDREDDEDYIEDGMTYDELYAKRINATIALEDILKATEQFERAINEAIDNYERSRY